MCVDDEYKDNCFGYADISSESAAREDGCDFIYEGGFKITPIMVLLLICFIIVMIKTIIIPM